MVYVTLIYHNLRVAALYELLLQLVDVAVVHVDSVYLSSRYHAVAHLGIGEVERVLENLDLIAHLITTWGTVDRRLQEIVEVHFSETLLRHFTVFPDAHQPQHDTREECGNLAYWPQDHIEQRRHRREERQQLVWATLKESLWQELSREKHYQG